MINKTGVNTRTNASNEFLSLETNDRDGQIALSDARFFFLDTDLVS